MRQFTTRAIILRRINYGESDRIVNFLTPTMGKVGALVRGVRKQRSRLAGGVELFSESEITFLETKGNLARITQARLIEHWGGDIVGDLPKMMFAYEAMKSVDKLVPEESGQEYYSILRNTLRGLGPSGVSLEAAQICFWVQLLSQSGHQPNFITDSASVALDEDSLYDFSLSDMVFVKSSSGEYRAEHIKLLRLGMKYSPEVLQKVQQFSQYSSSLSGLVERMAKYHLHL